MMCSLDRLPPTRQDLSLNRDATFVTTRPFPCAFGLCRNDAIGCESLCVTFESAVKTVKLIYGMPGPVLAGTVKNVCVDSFSVLSDFTRNS